MNIRLDPKLTRLMKNDRRVVHIVRDLAWEWISTRRCIKTISAMTNNQLTEVFHPSFVPADEEPFNRLLLDLYDLEPTETLNLEVSRMVAEGCPNDPDKTIEMDIPYVYGGGKTVGYANLPTRTVFKKGEVQ